MIRRALILASVALTLTTSCAVHAAPRRVVVRPARVYAPVSVKVASPPPVGPAKVVVPSVRPGHAYVWRAGHYVRRSGRYAWVTGAWVLPPRGRTVWLPGLWRSGVWVRGRWT